MKGLKKRQSKRMTLGKKHKIEKKVRDHNKKVRKEARKVSKAGIIKPKKTETGLPNSYPFKRKLVEAFERKKEKEEELKRSEKLRKKQELKELEDMNDKTIEAAANRGVVYQDQVKGEDKQQKNQTKRSSAKDLNKIITSSDIILEVLDARDPLGSRNKELEEKVLGMPGKKIVLVLNKSDLVPNNVTEKWLKRLRKEHPTVLYNSNTQAQVDSDKQGSTDLLEIIKSQSTSDAPLKVGLVGYPTVGKNSLLKSLTSNKMDEVSNNEGIEEVSLDSKVKLLNQTGTIASKEDEKSLVLKNIIKVENVKDPITPVEDILNKVNHTKFLTHYEIADFSNVSQLLSSVASRKGKLLKGGIPDLDAAARVILSDWNAGKLDYYTLPPTASTDKNSMALE